jgi:peptide subunit release factor 1 (eRF1)
VRREQQVLERWREEAGRNGRAATGWAATLEAASDGRVDVLLYRDGIERAAWRCPACGRLAAEAGTCPLDGTRMEERDAGLDLAVHQTLSTGGTIMPVTAGRDLDPVEGIAALLRY